MKLVRRSTRSRGQLNNFLFLLCADLALAALAHAGLIHAVLSADSDMISHLCSCDFSVALFCSKLRGDSVLVTYPKTVAARLGLSAELVWFCCIALVARACTVADGHGLSACSSNTQLQRKEMIITDATKP